MSVWLVAWKSRRSREWICLPMSDFWRATVCKKYINQNQYRADRDRRIRHIKCWIAVRAEQHLEKIRYRAVQNAVRKMSGGAPQKQCQTRGCSRRDSFSGDQIPGENGDHDQ